LFCFPPRGSLRKRVLSLKEAIEQAMSGNPQMRAGERALFAYSEDMVITKSFLLSFTGRGLSIKRRKKIGKR
jgi:hypothetical protein